MIAYCGLNCSGCPIYLATRVDDSQKQKQMREDIARQIEQHYGTRYRAEDVTDCDGCRTQDGRLFSACQQCGIRKCAREKGLENCAHCSEYACEQLKKFFSSDRDAKARLDAIRKAMHSNNGL